MSDHISTPFGNFFCCSATSWRHALMIYRNLMELFLMEVAKRSDRIIAKGHTRGRGRLKLTLEAVISKGHEYRILQNMMLWIKVQSRIYIADPNCLGFNSLVWILSEKEKKLCSFSVFSPLSWFFHFMAIAIIFV